MGIWGISYSISLNDWDLLSNRTSTTELEPCLLKIIVDQLKMKYLIMSYNFWFISKCLPKTALILDTTLCINQSRPPTVYVVQFSPGKLHKGCCDGSKSEAVSLCFLCPAHVVLMCQFFLLNKLSNLDILYAISPLGVERRRETVESFVCKTVEQ